MAILALSNAPRFSAAAVQQQPAIELLAEAALREEVLLTPKPGLVDGENTGAHRDMDLALFMRSIEAIAPWFGRFVGLGRQCAGLPATRVLMAIRPAGLA